MMKAKKFVMEATATETPPSRMVSPMRFSIESFGFVASKALCRTNIPSTPTPNMMKGRIDISGVNRSPIYAARPYAARTASPMLTIPACRCPSQQVNNRLH